RRYSEARLVIRRILDPPRIRDGGLAQWMALGEKAADAAVNEGRSCRIGDIATWVGPTLQVIRKSRIGRGSDIARGEVRLRHLIERRSSPSAVQPAQMERQRIVGWRWPRPVAHLLDVAWPCECERLLAPNTFEQGTIGSSRSPVDRAGNVGEAHFHGVGRRTPCLLGCWIAQSAARRTHVPEIAADKITL